MRDFSRADEDAEERAGVCVIGAGAAGQTVARRLAERGADVLLVESGGRDFDAATQDLADGDLAEGSESYYPVRDARLRLYGGTTAIWGGRCAPLDPIDFERRAWVAHSGWPISADDLTPYTDEAFAALGLPPHEGLRTLGLDPAFDPAKLDQPLWAFDDEAERFTSTAKDLEDAGVRIVLGATLTRIEAGEGGAVVACVFRNLGQRSLTVRARRFVLAAGGIENARLLLACAPGRPEGLGNARGLVGRYFMEHPHARIGEVVPRGEDAEGAAAALRLFPKHAFRRGTRYACALRPSEAVQAERGLLNTAASLALRPREGGQLPAHQRMIAGLKHGLPAKRRYRRAYHAAKQASLRVSARRYPGPVARRYERRRDTHGLFLVARAEQAPNPDSRVTLSDERDALGVRCVRLDWRLSEIDKRSARGLVTLLDEELTRLGVGAALPSAWLDDPATLWRPDPLVSAHAIGGYHHMGTTRMAATASEGVVDADGRLFEAPNLYVAGSSVFPTAGWANPTVTILALALRLGDHLAGQLRQSRYQSAKRDSPSASPTLGA